MSTTRRTQAPEPSFDVAVVGAGPAGLAAAGEAAHQGARVVVIDSSEQPGGQFWRHRSEAAGVADDGALHHSWKTYLALRSAFDEGIGSGAITYLPVTSVWMAQRVAATDGFLLRLTPSYGAGRAAVPSVRAGRLILATGAYDRQLPLPGWDLPGVMAAGGIQAFGKQNGMLPGKRFVIAGTGPFLLSVAAGVAHQGGHVAAVLESSNLMGWLPRAHRAAGVPAKALEGVEYVGAFLKHRIPYRPRTVITEILGEDRVTGVRTARVRRDGSVVPGSERQIDGIDTVGLGWGFTPQMELPVQLGAGTRQDSDGSLIAIVDEDQRSTIDGLFIAGELTGVGGAALAVLEGRVAGRVAGAEAAGAAFGARDAVAASAGSSASSIRRGATRSELRGISRQRSFAEAMNLAHPVPAGWQHFLHDDTIVCRCEEVPASALREVRSSMAGEDLRTQKGLNRAGMGWCQGRVCGFAVSCMASGADETESASSVSPGEERQPGASRPGAVSQPSAASQRGAVSRPGPVAQPSAASLAQSAKRPLAQPLPLSELAELADLD